MTRDAPEWIEQHSERTHLSMWPEGSMHTEGMTLMGPVFLQPPPTQQHVLRVKPKAARLQFGQREHL